MVEVRSGVVALISGSGTTLNSLARACEDKIIPSRIVCVVSSDPDAGGIEEARSWGLPVEIVDEKSPTFALDLSNTLKPYNPAIVAQLGWLPKTPDSFLGEYSGRVFNQHMGPGGKSMMGVRRVYAHQRYCEEIGDNKPFPIFCHRVDPFKGYDEGEAVYVAWERVSLEKDPVIEHEKLKKIEHGVQVEAYRRIASGEISYQPVPIYAQTPEELKLMEKIRQEAVRKFPKRKL